MEALKEDAGMYGRGNLAAELLTSIALTGSNLPEIGTATQSLATEGSETNPQPGYESGPDYPQELYVSD